MKSKLNTLLLCFSIIPLVIISLIALLFYTHRYNFDRKQCLIKNAESGSQIISYLLQNKEIELSSLSELQILVNCCNATISGSSTYNNLALNTLRNEQKTHSNYSVLTLYNQLGNIIVSTDAITSNTIPSNDNTINDDTIIEEITPSINNNRSVVSATLVQSHNITNLIDKIHKTNSPACTYTPPNDKMANVTNYIEFGAPIFSPNSSKIIGYLVLSVPPECILRYLNYIQLGESDCVFITDNEGNNLFSVAMDNDKWNSKYDYSDVIHKNLTAKKNSGYFACGSLFSKVQYGFNCLDNMDWYFVVTQDLDLVHSIFSYTLFFTLVCMCILLVIILVTSRKIAQRFTHPLIELRDCMRQAADGNLTILCNVKSKDEFGELSRSFNKMLHIIKSNYDELSFMHKKLLVKEEQLRNNYDHIEFLAYHDSLTKLPNKVAFYDYLSNTLEAEPGRTQAHAIFFIDLDNFKNVNDTLGHDYGDELLIQTAKRLNYFLKNNDLLARAGGDEFLFFKMNLQSQDEALIYANEILEKFKEPIYINGTHIYISLSIGISLYPLNGDKYTTLVKHADIAMYCSKDNGKNQVTMFDDSMQKEITRHSDVLEVLRHAIENKEIYLLYQPQFDLTLERIIGFEALMRINSKQLGYLTPSEFIPIAEESGMINDLGSWALYEACRFNKQLQDSGLPYCTVAVNISTIQLNQKGFVTNVMKILTETGLSPQFLELEITESAFISSITDAVAILEDLQNLGIRLSLDDFGTGYSSLNYLTQMPINTLKIDKAFIDKLNRNQKDNYIAEAIISLAHNLEVKVIAEGVEDCEQLRLLREKQCDLIQGYLYSKPLEARELINIL